MIKKRLVSVFFALVMVFSFPLTTWAGTINVPIPPSVTDSTAVTKPALEPVKDPTPTPSTPPNSQPTTTLVQTPSSPPPGPKAPTGPDANTYTYNSTTGLWENAYYTWDPITNQTKPKTPQTYSYNPSTGMWDTTEWRFDTPTQKYVPNVISVATNPLATQQSSISGSGPSSTNNITTNTKNDGLFNLFYDASISNKYTSNATSGNASILGNTTAGNALTGNATDMASIVNLLQSTWGVQPTQNLMTFTSNINGNVVGDLLLDPSKITNTGPLSVNGISSQTNNNLTVNSKGSGLISNDITLGAVSGNAIVAKNTNAGNATSGSANAVANVVNVLNSAISAGKSFLGVININGNLNGDILLPPNFLDQLIASSAPRASVNLSKTQNNNLTANLSSTQAINNNTSLAAASGIATVNNNTNAGSATTGQALTNLTIFNLTGRQVVGSNSLMVFVNVLGQWVGLIMNAPVGANTAALCGGTCNISSKTVNNTTINGASNNTITNNLKLNAQSGSATVLANTNAGSAKTGDATSSANILNINNSSFGLSNWFGILFINVYGKWYGSFGVNTNAGTVFKDSGGLNSGIGALPDISLLTPAQVFRFVPGNDQGSSTQSLFGGNAGTSGNVPSSPAGVVLTSSHKNASQTGAAHNKTKWTVPTIMFVVIFLLISIAGAGAYTERLRVWMISSRINKGRRAWPKFTLF